MDEDYERAGRREWDLHLQENAPAPSSSGNWRVATGSKRPHQTKNKQSPQKWTNARGPKADTSRQPARVPNLVEDVDNEAQQLWRSRAPPNATIRIPEELALQEDRPHEAIAQKNGVFLFSEDRGGIGGYMTFGMWAVVDGATVAASRELASWMAEWHQPAFVRSGRASNFAKIVSFTPEQRRRAEKKWKRDVKQAKFRQHPPPGSVFEAIGTFHWPSQEYRPEEILGKSYEAFDPIRMDCECYIAFLKERSLFQVSGKAENVQKALQRIRKTCFQIAARSVNPVRKYLLYWPSSLNLPSEVILQQYEHPKTLQDEVSETVSMAPRGESTADDQSRLQLQSTYSEVEARTAVLSLLAKLHYYRGDIRMRVRLGTFLARQYRMTEGGRYDFEDFESMIKESQFIGQVTKELGDKEMELSSLEALKGSDGLLLPDNPFNDKLEALRPVYSATFTFADEAGDLRLTKTWHETEDAETQASAFEEISKQWTRLECDGGGAAPLLDIALSDLNTGMAWQFDIEATQSIDETKLAKKYVDFSYGMKFDRMAALAQSSDKPFVTGSAYTTSLKHVEYRITYQYGMLTEAGILTDYTLELTRFQERRYPTTKTPGVSSATPSMVEPRWSVSIYRKDWDAKFSGNASLKIGERADWPDNIDSWFPEDPQRSQPDMGQEGFSHLLKNLKRVEQVISEARVEDLIGGMTIG